MATPTLHYFDAYGRAETARLILKYVGEEFNDHRMTGEEWGVMKQSGVCEFGQVPSLEIDGHHLVESASIERYLCKKFNLVAASIFDDYLSDSICELKADIVNEFLTARKEPATLEKFRNESLPAKLKLLEARYVAHGGEFFVGNSPTRADFVVFQFIHDRFLRPTFRESEFPLLTQHAPKLVEYAESFLKKSSNLQAYLAGRPEKPQ